MVKDRYMTYNFNLVSTLAGYSEILTALARVSTHWVTASNLNLKTLSERSYTAADSKNETFWYHSCVMIWWGTYILRDWLFTGNAHHTSKPHSGVLSLRSCWILMQHRGWCNGVQISSFLGSRLSLHFNRGSLIAPTIDVRTSVGVPYLSRQDNIYCILGLLLPRSLTV